MRFVYVIGPPAAGKSTFMRKVIAQLGPYERRRTGKGLRYSSHADGQLVLGRYDEGHPYPGLDTLPRDIGPHFRGWLASLDDRCPPITAIWAEGERLMNDPNLAAIQRLARLELYLLQPSAEQLAQNHKARNDTQSSTWLKGMNTRVTRMAKAYGARPLHLLPEYDLLK